MSDILERLVSALERLETKSMHTKAPANFNNATLLQQPGGIFNTAGMESDVISTHVRPMGLGSMLPVFASNLDDPRYGFLTGYTATNGSEPTNPCDDAPSGYLKAGTLTAQFGRVARDTNTIEIDKILHQQRGANTNLRLIGELLGQGDWNPSTASQQDVLNMVVQSEMVQVGVNMERKLATMLWTGVTTNNTSGGGYKEFPGLDYQVATGQVDAESNTAMPAADSIIMDFNYNLVDGTTLDIVDYVSTMEYNLRRLAMQTGMDPVTYAIVMRPELWAELSAVWPCRYQTNRCATDTGTNPVVINDNNNIAMRDNMRRTMTIEINGRTYPVIEDDGIYENTNINNANVTAGSYASSIYFLPLRVKGNFPVLYWEHIDYRQVQAQISALGAGSRVVPFWTTNGRFLWVYKTNGFCFNLQAKCEPRVVLRTPHLAGKIQSVRYNSMLHLRSPFPDSPYHQNGGVSSRSIGTSYHVWS